MYYPEVGQEGGENEEQVEVPVHPVHKLIWNANIVSTSKGVNPF